MAIEPAGHRVLIRPDKVEETSVGGIVLVKQHVEREQGATVKGVVLAVGPDAWYDKKSAWAKPGDRVIFAKYAGQVVGEEDDPLRIVNDEDILAMMKA